MVELMVESAGGIPEEALDPAVIAQARNPEIDVSRKGGGTVTIIDKDNTKNLLAMMPQIRETATQFTGERYESLVMNQFRSESGWRKNAPLTIKLKGHDKVLRGQSSESDALINNLESRTSLPGPNMTRTAVGFFDDPHPDTDGRLTYGALAAVHELGGDATGATSQFGKPLPSRPLLSPALDNNVETLFAAMETVMMTNIMLFNSQSRMTRAKIRAFSGATPTL